MEKPRHPRALGAVPLQGDPPLTSSRTLAVIPIAVLSFVITLPVLAANTTLRWYSWFPALIVACLSWLNLYLVSSFSWGYHGVAYTITCIAANFAFTAALAALWIAIRRRSSFAATAAFQALLSLWLATYAFAYLGELL